MSPSKKDPITLKSLYSDCFKVILKPVHNLIAKQEEDDRKTEIPIKPQIEMSEAQIRRERQRKEDRRLGLFCFVNFISIKLMTFSSHF